VYLKVRVFHSVDWLQMVQERIHWWAVVSSYKVSETIKGGEIFEQLNDDQSLNKDSTP
jgi:hypothetical protein